MFAGLISVCTTSFECRCFTAVATSRIIFRTWCSVKFCFLLTSANVPPVMAFVDIQVVLVERTIQVPEFIFFNTYLTIKLHETGKKTDICFYQILVTKTKAAFPQLFHQFICLFSVVVIGFLR